MARDPESGLASVSMVKVGADGKEKALLLRASSLRWIAIAVFLLIGGSGQLGFGAASVGGGEAEGGGGGGTRGGSHGETRASPTGDSAGRGGEGQ